MGEGGAPHSILFVAPKRASLPSLPLSPKPKPHLSQGVGRAVSHRDGGTSPPPLGWESRLALFSPPKRTTQKTTPNNNSSPRASVAQSPTRVKEPHLLPLVWSRVGRSSHS